MLFEETSSIQNHKVSESFENLLQEIYDRKNTEFVKFDGRLSNGNAKRGVSLGHDKAPQSNDGWVFSCDK